MYALCGVVTHVFGLLRVTRVYAKPKSTPMKHVKCVEKYACSCKPKCTSTFRANQNARVQFVQTKVHE